MPGMPASIVSARPAYHGMPLVMPAVARWLSACKVLTARRMYLVDKQMYLRQLWDVAMFQNPAIPSVAAVAGASQFRNCSGLALMLTSYMRPASD